MPKTRDEVITRTLRLLGAIASNQPASAEDAQLVSDVLEPVRDQLATYRVIYIGNLEAVADAAFLPFCVRVACEVAADFGQDTIQGLAVPTAAIRAEADLRALAVDGPDSGQPVPAEYF